jgi:hypothetical protein
MDKRGRRRQGDLPVRVEFGASLELRERLVFGQGLPAALELASGERFDGLHGLVCGRDDPGPV